MSGAGYAGRHPSSGGTPAPEQPRRSRYDYENFSQFRGRCGVLNEPIFAAVPPRRKPGLPPSRQRGGAAEIADRGRPSETKDTEPVYGSIPDTASCNPSGARQVPRRDSLGLYKNQMYAASGPPDCRLHLGDEPCDTDTDTGPDPENAHPPPQSPAPQAWVTPRVFWLAQLAVGAAVLMLLIPLLITMATGGTCQACETKELRDQLQSLQIRVGDVAIMVLNMRKEKYGKPEAPPAESQHVPVSGLTATDSPATHRTDRRGPPAEGRLQPEVLPDPARVKEPLQKLAEEAHDVARDTDPVRTAHSALVPGPTADTPEPPLIPAAVQENRPGLPVDPFLFPVMNSAPSARSGPGGDPDHGRREPGSGPGYYPSTGRREPGSGPGDKPDPARRKTQPYSQTVYPQVGVWPGGRGPYRNNRQDIRF